MREPTVATVMTRTVSTATPDTTFHELAGTIAAHDLTGLRLPRSMPVRAELAAHLGVATVTRFPASTITTHRDDAHLVVDTDEQDAGLVDLANTFVYRRPSDEHWLTVTLSMLRRVPTGHGASQQQ